MDCRTVLDHLDLLTTPEREVVDVEIAEHLNVCSVCRNHVAQRTAFDKQVRRSLLAVDIPEGLEGRLLSVIDADHASSRMVPSKVAIHPQTPVPNRQRSWLMASLALLLLLGLALQPWWSSPSLPELDYVATQQSLSEQFRRDLHVWESLPEFDGSFPVHLDRELMKLHLSAPHGVDLDGDNQHDVAVYHFSLERWNGVLIVMSQDRFEGIPEQTSPRMISGQRSLEWRSADGSTAYLCFVHRGSVEQFQSALFGSLA